MTMKIDGPRMQLLFLSGLAVVTGVAIGIDAGVIQGVVSGALAFALAALLYLGRDRFDLINVMSGSGDERTRTLYTRATAFAGSVLIGVITCWWLAASIEGEVNETLTVLVAIGSVSFVAAAAYLARRG